MLLVVATLSFHFPRVILSPSSVTLQDFNPRGLQHCSSFFFFSFVGVFFESRLCPSITNAIEICTDTVPNQELKSPRDADVNGKSLMLEGNSFQKCLYAVCIPSDFLNETCELTPEIPVERSIIASVSTSLTLPGL